MNGLRRAYVLDKTKEVVPKGSHPTSLHKTYRRARWDELKRGDVVVLVEPDGTLVEGGAEYTLIEDPWVEPELGLHVIKTLDPVTAVHREAAHEPVHDEAAEGALLGADQAGVQAGPGASDGADG